MLGTIQPAAVEMKATAHLGGSVQVKPSRSPVTVAGPGGGVDADDDAD